MIDRLELKTNLYGHFIESRNKSIPKGISQLIEEDTDIIELRRSDTNPLYRNAIQHTILAPGGKPTDDPVKFYIYSDPRYNKQTADRYKIVFNPNNTPMGEVIQFLRINFPATTSRKIFDENGNFLRNEIQLDDQSDDENFFSNFKIGRIDFNVDVSTHTVQEIFRTLYIDNKTQKHTAIFTDDEKEFKTNAIRTIGTKQLETFYIGKGMYLFRAYDKVKEAIHKITQLKNRDIEPTQKLINISLMKTLTRLEFQIRDLYRAGIMEEKETVARTTTSARLKHKRTEVTTPNKKHFKPTMNIHYIRTLGDLLKIKRPDFDVFSKFKFQPGQYATLARQTARASQKQKLLNQQWIIDSFNALIDSIGISSALKKIDPETRRELKRQIHYKDFQHDLNKTCFDEIKNWLERE